MGRIKAMCRTLRIRPISLIIIGTHLRLTSLQERANQTYLSPGRTYLSQKFPELGIGAAGRLKREVAFAHPGHLKSLNGPKYILNYRYNLYD